MPPPHFLFESKAAESFSVAALGQEFVVLEEQASLYMGERHLSLMDQERDRPIKMVVWYPTTQKSSYHLDGVWEMATVAKEAPLAEGKRPLVLLSHGWGGEKIEQMWLAEALVKEGYIVCAIDHYGNTWKTYSEEVSLEFSHRPKDISAALDFLLEDSPFNEAIDSQRIGFAGYSMGGLTGLFLAGGEVDGPSYQDSRIQAFFLMAPRGFDFSPSSLEKIDRPIAIVSGENDAILPIEKNALMLGETIPSATVHIFEGEAGHPIFLNCPTDLGKKELAEEITLDPPSVDRHHIHQEASSLATQLFKFLSN